MNSIRSYFCNHCGKPLVQELRCPQCGRVNPAGSCFCNGCGAALPSTGPQRQFPSHQPSRERTPHPPPPAPSPPEPETGFLAPQSVLSGRYVISRCVGRGGMGAVYQAADIRIPGKTWAIKEMSDTAITNPLDKQHAIAAFRQEALMLARLDHPNLPKVTDHFTEGGKQYLVMDFIVGETLGERLEQVGGGPLPVDDVRDWGHQLCDVLGYLHSQNPPVIFRDLKPRNVMLTPDATVKLIDFGIARLFKPGKATDTAFFGTVGYSPREQYGGGQTDARSDIYALGATLYHLLTGVSPTEMPFDLEDIRSINSQVPAPITEAVMKALSEDPAERWQSAEEMGEALTREPSPPPKLARQSKLGKRPKVSPVLQPAAAAAQVNEDAIPQRISVPATSRLNFWRGIALVLTGAALHGGLVMLTLDTLEEYVEFPQAAFAFIPALFGILFGPWIGGATGVLGSLVWNTIGGWYSHVQWGIALSACTMGVLPGLIVKDARNRKEVLGAGVLGSVMYALAVPVAVGVLEEWWYDFWYIAVQVLIPALPLNVLLLPFLARWLVRPVQRRGLYWRDTRPDSGGN
jgi:serine/threonine-protein kinase